MFQPSSQLYDDSLSYRAPVSSGKEIWTSFADPNPANTHGAWEMISLVSGGVLLSGTRAMVRHEPGTSSI